MSSIERKLKILNIKRNKRRIEKEIEKEAKK